MQLHKFMMSYFKNLATHRGAFSEEIVPDDFLDIAKRHKSTVYKRLEKICEELNKLSADAQKKFCMHVAISNDIQAICERRIKPVNLQNIPQSIKDLLTDLFLSLYSQILRGNNEYSKKYGNIQDHFLKFRELNSDITICPFCGITELKTQFDSSLEQYDHYLSKTLYPLSAVNFHNLIPTCKDCNGLDYKANKDILALGTEKIFYPFNTLKYRIIITFQIVKQPEIKDWRWVTIITSDGVDLQDEIISWDKIYDIKNRFEAHIKGRIFKWLDFYFEFKRKASLRGDSEAHILETFKMFLDTEEEFGLDFLRRPAFSACINNL